MTITAGQAQAYAGQIGDLMTAIQYRLANVAADEQLAEDILTDIGGPYALAIEAIVPLIGWAITHNQSATPGALVHLPSGDRGSDPFRNEPMVNEDDGA